MREERLGAGTEYEVQPFGIDLVFRSNSLGQPMHPNSLTKLMSREWTHADVTPRATLHGLRHAVASQLILNGMSVTDAAANIGDKPQTVALFYQHELDAVSRRSQVSDLLDSLYG